MAKVLSTKEARKRFIISVPALPVGTCILYGMSILFFGNPLEATGFDGFTAELAAIVTIILIAVAFVALVIGSIEFGKRWVDSAK